MSFIDFSPFHTPTGIGQALDPVAEAVTRWRQRTHQKEMQDKQLALQSQVQNRLASNAEAQQRHQISQDTIGAQRVDNQRRQQVGQATMANTEQRRKVAEAARAKAARGDISGAEADLNNVQQLDPTTGRVMSGRDVIPFDIKRPNIGEPPQQPDLEDARPAEPSYSDFHEQADEMGTNAAIASAAGGRNAVKQRGFDTQKAAYDASAARAPLDTTVSIGGSQPQTVGEMRRGAGPQEAGDFGQYVAALEAQRDDPVVQRKLQQANRLGPMVAAGKLTADKASEMVEKGIATGEQQQFTGGQGDLNRQNALDKQALANQKPRSLGPMGDTKEEQVKLSRLRMLEQGIERFQKNFKIPEDRQEQHKLSMSLDNEDNPAVQRSLVYNGLSRGLAGEKGALSKDDVTRIQGQLAGKLGEFQNWWSELKTGKMGDAKLAVVRDAIQMVLRDNEARTQQAKQRFKAGFLGPASPYRGWGLQDYTLDRANELFGEGAGDEMLSQAGRGAPNMPPEAGGLVGIGRKKRASASQIAPAAATAGQETPEQRAARLEKLLEERGL